MSDFHNNDKAERTAGLRRFAVAISILNILGYSWLGFEQSYIQPFIAVFLAYCLEFIFEITDVFVARKLQGEFRAPRFSGGPMRIIDFLLSAHITALAISMLLYSNSSIAVTVFAITIGISSKWLLLAPVHGNMRHVFNPSNFGITITLLVFPWVGIAPPYQFTENISGMGDWILPAIIVVSGSLLNSIFTKRVPLLLGWVLGFVIQAYIRHFWFDASLLAALGPITGVAFILFTFYMITDPATTPKSYKYQLLFGASTAAVYGILVVNHLVFGLFFALTTVCFLRGLWSCYELILVRRRRHHKGL